MTRLITISNVTAMPEILQSKDTVHHTEDTLLDGLHINVRNEVILYGSATTAL